MSGNYNKQLRMEIEREKEKYLKRMMEVGNESESNSTEEIKSYPQMISGVRFPDPLATTCTCEKFSQKLTDIKDSLKQQLVSQETMQQQLNVLQGQLKVTIELLAEQSVLIKRNNQNPVPQQHLELEFPINCEEDLIELDSNITDDNKMAYTTIVKNLIQNEGITRNLKYILGIGITDEYNLDGTHGKKSLKEYANVYQVVRDAIKMTKEGQTGPADSLFRKAIQAQKKRGFKLKASLNKVTIKKMKYDDE